jgi:hypothetical protein
MKVRKTVHDSLWSRMADHANAGAFFVETRGSCAEVAPEKLAMAK